MAYTFQQLETILEEAGANTQEAPLLASVGAAESSFGSNLGPSPTGDYGIWQINEAFHPTDPVTGQPINYNLIMESPYYSAQTALNIYRTSGINAWTTAWSNDNGKTKVPFNQSAAGQILTQQGVAGTIPSTGNSNTSVPGSQTTSTPDTTGNNSGGALTPFEQYVNGLAEKAGLPDVFTTETPGQQFGDMLKQYGLQAGFIALALAFIAGGFVWMAAPSIKIVAKDAAEV